MIICKTENELERALQAKEAKIIFEGSKASEIVQMIEKAQRKKRNARRIGLGAGILCLIAAPFTAGTSLLGLGATAGAIAISDSVIIAIIGAVTSISSVVLNRIYDYKIAKLDNNRIQFTHK